jgi:fructokinase
VTAVIAGVELGGTKCVCTLALPTGEILAQEMVPTTGAEETLGALEQILSRWWGETPFGALGIASFGPVDLDRRSPSFGHLTMTPKPGWRDADIAGRLNRRFPVPNAFDTDVNGAAMAELRWGAGKGLSDFAYITVGTGVGVGLIVDGRPTRGFAHAELGHIRVVRAAEDSWPGTCPYHGDCVEGLASGPAVAARLGSGKVQDMGADHPVWHSVAHALAQLCHVLACGTAPQRIVMGGGVMTGQPHLMDRIERLLIESLAGYRPLPQDGPYVTAPGLGDRAGPLGPVALAIGNRRDEG